MGYSGRSPPPAPAFKRGLLSAAKLGEFGMHLDDGLPPSALRAATPLINAGGGGTFPPGLSCPKGRRFWVRRSSTHYASCASADGKRRTALPSSQHFAFPIPLTVPPGSAASAPAPAPLPGRLPGGWPPWWSRSPSPLPTGPLLRSAAGSGRDHPPASPAPRPGPR